ncbi:MAG: hypothetical protein KDI36_03255 [Pseudomonadales bacterium]|nr:hypothetical protein [Pseudomonadales bacterium]
MKFSQLMTSLCCFCWPLVGLPAPEDAFGLTTCAVYHRMIIAGYRSDGNIDLAEREEHLLTDFTRRAEAATIAEYGEEEGRAMFRENWNEEMARMTDLINRNYRNNRQLKVRYEKRCEP